MAKEGWRAAPGWFETVIPQIERDHHGWQGIGRNNDRGHISCMQNGYQPTLGTPRAVLAGALASIAPLLRTLFSIVSAMAFWLPFSPPGCRAMTSAMPVLAISSSRPMSSKGGNLARLVGFDAGVDQVAHVGLAGLQVEGFAAGPADDFADVQAVVELPFDAGAVGVAVAGGFQFVGDVGVGAHQDDGRLIERGARRFPLFRWDGISVLPQK